MTQLFRQHFGQDTDKWTLIVKDDTIVGLHTKFGDFNEVKITTYPFIQYSFYKCDTSSDGYKFKIVFNYAEEKLRIYRNLGPYCYADSKIALRLWEIVDTL